MLAETLVGDLVTRAAQRWPAAVALRSQDVSVCYEDLHAAIARHADGLLALGMARGDRIAVWLDKSVEMVVACFGAAFAGGVFVPVNPVLKPAQVRHVLADSGARVLVTTAQRLSLLGLDAQPGGALRHAVVVGEIEQEARVPNVLERHAWSSLANAPVRAPHRVIDVDMAAILYTSGSTGLPKGVVLSHRNLVAGAASVAGYLGNNPGDTVLAALPLSFDAGFSQLTTAFYSGARAVLLNYLLPRDLLQTMVRERVTGLTAVPPLYIQLAALDWPEPIAEHLRYFANTGGHLPRDTLAALRRRAPRAEPYLMYGLTEAFRSTYLPPDQVDLRPDSIGKAIPNAEILVLREDGTPCAPEEPGELVHRGALVGMGYWNDPERTAERYRPLPGRAAGIPLPEFAVFSGDTVRMDHDGYLYFLGRRDEMIKSSGYRISPHEVESVLYATGLVGECAVFGVAHAGLGQAVHVVATPVAGTELDANRLLAECRKAMPAYMVPGHVRVVAGPLLRTPNGKIDRRRLAAELGSPDAP